MFPILYESNEQAFTSNGLGRLTDCIDCVVTEERNGQYELELNYPFFSSHYADLLENRIILAKTCDKQTLMSQWQPFIIYEITRPLNGIVTVYAHHISYLLKKMTVKPFTATSASSAFVQIASKIDGTHPFTFWTDKTTSANQIITEPTACRSVLGGMEGSVLDVYGGEYEFDRFTVKLHNNRGKDNGVTIRYGKNLTDISSDMDYTDTYTAVIPYWTGQDDSGEEVVVIASRVDSEHTGDYAYQQTVPLDLSTEFSEKPTFTELTEKATAWMENNKTWQPKSNIKISFQPLYQTEEYKNIAQLERVSLCDTVTVIHNDLGVNVQAEVITTVFDVINERYNQIELGDARSSFSNAIAKETDIQIKQAASSWLEKVIEQSSNFIKQGLGGYVVFNKNADGQNNEILIMDNPDKDLAVNVIRMNMHGIAFSKDGYNGTYTTAWTIDGKFNADFIASGTLSANYIQGGTLTLGGADNANGLMSVRDASNNEVIKIDNTGFKYTNTGTIELGTFDFYNGNTGYTTTKNALKVTHKYAFYSAVYGPGDIYSKSGLNMVAGDTSNKDSPTTQLLLGNNNVWLNVGETGTWGTVDGVWTSNKKGLEIVISENMDEERGSLSIGRSNKGENKSTYTSFLSAYFYKNLSDSHFYFYASIYTPNDVSDKRMKHDIVTIETTESEKLIYSLSPKKFKLNNLDSGRTHHGFIAQDVEEILEDDNFAFYIPSTGFEFDGIEGDIKGLEYRELIADLVNVAQSQKSKIDELEARIARLEAKWNE